MSPSFCLSAVCPAPSCCIFPHLPSPDLLSPSSLLQGADLQTYQSLAGVTQEQLCLRATQISQEANAAFGFAKGRRKSCKRQGNFSGTCVQQLSAGASKLHRSVGMALQDWSCEAGLRVKLGRPWEAQDPGAALGQVSYQHCMRRLGACLPVVRVKLHLQVPVKTC